ncbi:hypothetical protein ABW19_dt0210573 [Dactylella cylindrospora]|nr:hypothetical protein ABW19_dt0210573 [Dactylella cylindrospora]
MSSTEVSMDEKNLIIEVIMDTQWLFEGFQTTKGSDLIATMANFFMANPDWNETGYNDKIAQVAGTSVENVDLLELYWGDWGTYSGYVQFANETIPVLGHPTQNPVFLPIFVVLTLITVGVVITRFYSRMTITGFIRSYDWVLLAGFVLTFGFGMQNAVILNTNTYYKGLWDKNWLDFQVEQDSSLSASILYPITVLVIKSSLLLFYYNLSVWHPLRWATIFTGVVVLCNTIATIFGWVFQCDPILPWKHQNYMNPNGSCPVDTWKLEVATGSVNIITDVIIWVIPLPMIWKMQLSFRERLISVLTLGVGALACIACGMRVSMINKAWYGSQEEASAAIICTWTITELYLAQICASIPAIRALLLKKAPNFLGTEVGQRKGVKPDQYDQFGDFSSGTSIENDKTSPNISIMRQESFDDNASNRV